LCGTNRAWRSCVVAAFPTPLDISKKHYYNRSGETFMRTVIALRAGALVCAALTVGLAGAQTRADRFRVVGTADDEETPADAADPSVATDASRVPRRFTEAPAGFDSETNGFLPQGPPFETINEDNVVPSRSFNDNRFVFEETETAADGLGPVYNAQSCRECHQNVATGGASQIAEHRTGRLDSDTFFESLGGSLVHSRATNPEIVERVMYQDSVRTFRISTNTLGDGFVEAIPNRAIQRVRMAQPEPMRGLVLPAPVLEANGKARIGRFGWKSQHASLLSFAADAYLNEMGVTSPLFPEENTSSGTFVGFGTPYDSKPDPEDDGKDVRAFADFMRSTKAPSRGPITPSVQAGETIFANIGCGTCHTATYRTAAPGTQINGGTYTISDAIGNKIIHPYSDFLVHDIGTGDGIPVQATAEFAWTANVIRTAPLWGMRTRSRLMHDGLTFTEREAIERHGGQAADVTAAYQALSDADKELLRTFLDSL
jgi:CxxC motif-containing protein (DUF1111 family)